MNLTVWAATDSRRILGAEAPLSSNKNPTLSTSYRPTDLSAPNRTVIDVQQRVCTGSSQTKPLDVQTMAVLGTIVRSAFTWPSAGLITGCHSFVVPICIAMLLAFMVRSSKRKQKEEERLKDDEKKNKAAAQAAWQTKNPHCL